MTNLQRISRRLMAIAQRAREVNGVFIHIEVEFEKFEAEFPVESIIDVRMKHLQEALQSYNTLMVAIMEESVGTDEGRDRGGKLFTTVRDHMIRLVQRVARIQYDGTIDLPNKDVVELARLIDSGKYISGDRARQALSLVLRTYRS